MEEQIFIVKNPSTNYIKQVAKKIDGIVGYKNITPAAFIKRTIKKILQGNAMFLMSFSDETKETVTGFVMLSEFEDYDGKVLVIENAWLEKTNRTGNEFWDAIKNIAKTLGYKKVIAETKRSVAAINKKYGFTERSRIIEYNIQEAHDG